MWRGYTFTGLMELKLGYIGLGLMGGGMARNLLKAGFSVTVHNRSRGKVDALVAEGASATSSPREVAEASDIVFTNLPDGPDVEKVVLGDEGIMQAARPGLIVVDHSTIAPAIARHIAAELAKVGVSFLDAPVSGGDVGARAGTLTIMVGGEAKALERARPALEAMGKTITHVGASGAGQVTKAANQIMVAAQMVAEAELLVLAQKSGVDPAVVVEAIRGGAAQCWTLDQKPQRLLSGERGPGFKAVHQAKDLGIVLQTAKECGATLPLTAVATQLFNAQVARGEGDLDNSAVLGVIEALSNTRVGPEKENTVAP